MKEFVKTMYYMMDDMLWIWYGCVRLNRLGEFSLCISLGLSLGCDTISEKSQYFIWDWM